MKHLQEKVKEDILATHL